MRDADPSEFLDGRLQIPEILHNMVFLFTTIERHQKWTDLVFLPTAEVLYRGAISRKAQRRGVSCMEFDIDTVDRKLFAHITDPSHVSTPFTSTRSTPFLQPPKKTTWLSAISR